MYFLLKYTVLLILPYQCITTNGIGHEKLEDVFGYDQPKSAGNHCVILFTSLMEYFMPVPYHANTTVAAIITPDQNGHFAVAHKRSFQLSCSGSTFLSPTACLNRTEVTVECRNGSVVAYEGEEYEFNLFRCNALPKAKLTAANASCGGIANGVFGAGFYTREPFSFYKVCFDAGNKRTLFSWNYVDTPLFGSVQMSSTLAPFVETENFEHVDYIEIMYGRLLVKNKPQYLGDPSVTTVMSKNIREVIVPGHLLFRSQFFYLFQQFGTYFFENTAPLWAIFNNGVWHDVELLLLKSMYSSKGKHLIVTGTINSTQLKIPPKNLPVQKWIGDIPVPIYIWRWVYNVQSKKGIVFIGLNSPLQSGNRASHFCKTVSCPGELGQKIVRTNLIFCCSIESFEKAYGPIDPIVFQEF